MAHLVPCTSLYMARAHSVRIGVEKTEAGVLRRVKLQNSELVKEFEFFHECVERPWAI